MELPVDPARLRREFPDLSDADLDAFVEVTRRILDAAPPDRGRVTRGIVASARQAREKATSGTTLTSEESLLARYLDAVDKMQRSTAPRG